MICPIKRKGSWVGCLGWQRGRVRTFFLFNPFPLFQIKVEPLNSYFSIIQRKKGTFRNQWQSLYSSPPSILKSTYWYWVVAWEIWCLMMTTITINTQLCILVLGLVIWAIWCSMMTTIHTKIGVLVLGLGMGHMMFDDDNHNHPY